MRETQGLVWGILCVLVAGCSGGGPDASGAECSAGLSAEQGFSMQGMSQQGMNLQGLSGQGLSVQGLTAQGLSPQGFSAQGLSPQGFSAQGISAQGLQAQGISAQGLSVQGSALSGIALRGVEADMAARWASGAEATLPATSVVRLELERGVLSGRTMAGETLREGALVGLLLPFATREGQTSWISLTAVAAHPDAPELQLYTLKIGEESLCEAGAGGLFVPGAWDESGARFDSLTAGDRKIDTTFSCLAGVLAKCEVWGYAPWTVGPELHQACTRMARADYCGDGVPHTQNGTLIDMFDTRKIQTPVVDARFSFEAAWGQDGAVCVREPRYLDEDSSGQRILPSCWADKPRCETFEEGVALGAELGNDSAHTPRVQSATAGCR